MRLNLDIFDEPRDEHLDASSIEAVLDLLLEKYPDAAVVPLRDDAVSVPMPASIRLQRNSVIKTRSALTLIVYENDVAEAWERAKATGLARCGFRMAKLPDMTGMNYMFDLRENHGVMLTVSVMAAADATGKPPIEPDAPAIQYVPRSATITKDAGAVISGVDESITQLLGWDADELIGRRSIDLIHPDDHAAAVDNWLTLMQHPGPGRRVRLRHRHKDGSWIWFEVINHNHLLDLEHERVVAEMVDISEEMTALEELHKRERLLDRIAEAVPVGLMQIDADLSVVYTNDRVHEILGRRRGETLDARMTSIAPEDRPRLRAALAEVLRGGQPADVEARVIPHEGDDPKICMISLRTLTADDESIIGAIVCVTDMTDSARMREELIRRATFDDLTGCQSRASIMHTLAENIDSGRRQAERAVVYADVDNFKEVNDEHGHAVGDALLRVIANRLRAAIRENDVVGRVGGDEFVVLCPEIGGPAEAMALADRVATAIRNEAVTLPDGRTIAAQVSVGVAWSSGDALDADTLVAHADHAMYESKRERIGVPKLAAAA